MREGETHPGTAFLTMSAASLASSSASLYILKVRWLWERFNRHLQGCEGSQSKDDISRVKTRPKVSTIEIQCLVLVYGDLK